MKTVPLGENSRSSPFPYSLLPLWCEQYGSAKKRVSPKAFLMPSKQANLLPRSVVAVRYQKYAAQHPQQVFIYDGEIMFPGDLWMTTTVQGRAPNLINFGGSLYYSPLYYKQLHALSLQELILNTLLLDNVYFFSSLDLINQSQASVVYQLLLDCGVTGVTIVDSVEPGGIYIYSFETAPETECNTSGFHERNRRLCMGIPFYKKDAEETHVVSPSLQNDNTWLNVMVYARTFSINKQPALFLSWRTLSRSAMMFDILRQ